MSLFSRLFRRAPLSPQNPASPSQPELSRPAEQASAAPAARALAAAAEDKALQSAMDARDVPAIARLVISGGSTKIRQRAAQAIEDPEVLRQLIRDVRGGNDKSVYKILTAKRDALLVEARRLEQLRADVQAAAAAIERHSQRPYDALYGATLDQLEARWRAVVGDAAPEVSQRVQQAIDTAREVIATHLRQVAVEASRQLAAANAAAEAQRLREVREKGAAVAAAEQAQVAAEQRRQAAEKREAEQLAQRQLGGLIRKARGALDEGSTGRAAGLRRAIEEKLAASPPLPGYLASQLQQLDKRLEELKDWKSFSVTPKRAELIADMEGLVESTLDPPVLADRIKALQEEWRTLSKGAGENLEADWQRFHEAAQKAYQPCREYFEAQALVRAQNLQRREALLARLTAFEAAHDWEQPNWRQVITALRESKQEWRGHSPVERAAGKPLEEKFGALTAGLQTRLDAEYARSSRQKELLIERARQLLSSDDSRQAIESVKELQQDWRAVGPVPRAADHRLWEEFRQHCDAIFQKRQQEYASYTAGLDSNKTRALELCQQLEKLAHLSGPEWLQGAQSVPQLRADFEALGEFPRAEARALHNRFERAVERCEQALEQQHRRAAERAWEDLFAAAERVRAYRLAVVRGVDNTEQEALRQAAEAGIAAVERWPKGALEAIKQGLVSQSSHDVPANETALRMLCIRAEILTNVPTPAEDQPLRREYQVQRLMQSMGQGIQAGEAQIDALALEWIGVGPVEEGTYGLLLSRFRRCRLPRLLGESA